MALRMHRIEDNIGIDLIYWYQIHSTKIRQYFGNHSQQLEYITIHYFFNI